MIGFASKFTVETTHRSARLHRSCGVFPIVLRFTAALACVCLAVLLPGCAARAGAAALPPGVRALSVDAYRIERYRLAGLRHEIGPPDETLAGDAANAPTAASRRRAAPVMLWADTRVVSGVRRTSVNLLAGSDLPMIAIGVRRDEHATPVTLTCGIDSGGDFALVLSARRAEELGCAPIVGFDSRSRGIGGERARPVTIVPIVTLGDVEIGPVVAQIDRGMDDRRAHAKPGQTPPPDALIGVQLLERFARVAIDARAGVFEIDADTAAPSATPLACLPWTLHVIQDGDAITLGSAHRVTPATIDGRAVLAVLDTRAEPGAVVNWTPSSPAVRRDRLIGTGGGHAADVFLGRVSFWPGVSVDDAEVFGGLSDPDLPDAVIGKGVLGRWRVEFRARDNQVLFLPSRAGAPAGATPVPTP